MDDKLLHCYERELTFLRQMGAEFARKYPKIAGRLLLEPDKCEDPHTERLIEAVAFLCGRIHRKIEDDFPEITEALLGIVYPHYVRPIPSMTVVRFDPIVKNVPPTGYRIDRNTTLYSRPVGGLPCQFSTAYPVTLWPVEVTDARIKDPRRAVKGAQQALVVRLKTAEGLDWSQLSLERLRFFLSGPGQHVFPLYELIGNNTCHIELEAAGGPGKGETVTLPPDYLRPLGFDEEDTLVPFPRRSFPGYRLLFEYFCFPEKFLFFELRGLDRTRRWARSDTVDLWLTLNRPAPSNLVLTRETFCLNAAPAINLFPRIAEPIRVEHRKTRYHVIADVRRREAVEVFSVDRVSAWSPDGSSDVVVFEPFYSLRHHCRDEDAVAAQTFYQVERRPSGRRDDEGTEVHLSFTDAGFKPEAPGVEILTVHTTCTNRDLPSRLPFGDPAGDFEMETAAPTARISCLIKPTPTRRPTLGGALQWRLISHLALNYLSLLEASETALKEILRLYDFDDSPVTRRQIEGIVSVRSSFVTKRVGMAHVRGVQIELTLDEDKFVGSGAYLFASVLERFFGQYVSLNAFTQLAAKTLQRKEPLRRWPPRSGSRILL